MDQKIASASGQEEEMKGDPNQQNFVTLIIKSSQTVAFNTLLNTSQHGTRKKSIQLQRQSLTYTIRLNTSSQTRNEKQNLTNAQSYGETETSSYHGLAVARMEITWPRLYHQRIPRLHQQKFDTKMLKTVPTNK